MVQAPRTIRVVTTDDSILASTRTAASAIGGWEVVQVSSQEELLASSPPIGDLILIDAWVRGRNVYEFCRSLSGTTRCRTYLVVDEENDRAASIARFCGATGTLPRPLTPSALNGVLESASASAPPPAPLPDQRGEDRELDLPEALLTDLSTGEPSTKLIRALIDPDTGLFNYEYLNFKVDEEFKRARRFDCPLACVMLGFEGQASSDVLRELAAIFLQSSRDTDVLGRFDENSFLFLLPSTGPDGAGIMAHRVAEMAADRDLQDLVGDPLAISVGISYFPDPTIEDCRALFRSSREAFLEARAEGGGVVVG